MDRQMEFPLLKTVSRMFPAQYRTRTTDSASANIRAETASNNESPPSESSFHVKCTVHRASTAQGHAYGPSSGLISDLLGFSLSQRPGGAPCKFRAALAHVLSSSVKVYKSRAPDLPPQQLAYREACLAAFLPEGIAGSERRLALCFYLNGNWSSEKIAWYTEDVDPDVKHWASEAARALYPSATAVNGSLKLWRLVFWRLS
jgi:hypothetical protein